MAGEFSTIGESPFKMIDRPAVVPGPTGTEETLLEIVRRGIPFFPFKFLGSG
jgi:hypothetical protein